MRFWGRDRKLEARLRAARPKARDEFVRSVARDVDGRGRRRIPVAATVVTGLTLFGLVAASAFGGLGLPRSGGDAGKKGPLTTPLWPMHHAYPKKVAICHRTGSDTNPYVLILVSENALPAHANHPPQGNPPRSDIIPAPAGGCPSR